MIANHKGEIPFVVLLLPFLAGVVCGYNFHVNIFLLSAALAITCTAFIGLNLTYTPLKLYKYTWLGGFLTTWILLLMGWFITINHHDLYRYNHFSGVPAQYLDAVITSEPKAKDGLVRFTAEIKNNFNHNKPTATTGLLLVTIKDDLAFNLFYGEELLIPANYKPVDPPFNPAEFNYKKYLADKNIYHQVFLYPKQYRVVKARQGNALVAYALQLRQNLVKKLTLNMRDTNAIAVASTLILGYKADLSNDILQAYSKTGTIHILSVSGGHVAIIYLLLNWVLGFLSTYRYGKIVKAITIVALIWAYALLTGFSPAVCRAALIISMVITGKTYSRYINSLNLLAASAFALLLYDPFLLTDVGFQQLYLTVFLYLIALYSNIYKFSNSLVSLCSVFKIHFHKIALLLYKRTYPTFVIVK